MPVGKYGTVYSESIAECHADKTSIIKTGYIFDPISMGGTANAFSLNDSQTLVVGLTKVGGYIFGRFCNSPGGSTVTYKIPNTVPQTGNHCEDFFMSAWDEVWDSPVMMELRVPYAIAARKLPVTLKLTKSPCHICAQKLIAFAEGYQIDLRLKILKLYSGDKGEIVNATALLAMLSKGLGVKMWEVHVVKQDYTGLTKKGQNHELRVLKEHLRAAEQQSHFLLTADSVEDIEERTESEKLQRNLSLQAIKQKVDAMLKWQTDINQFQWRSLERIQKTLSEINAGNLHGESQKKEIQQVLLAISNTALLKDVDEEFQYLSESYYQSEKL